MTKQNLSDLSFYSLSLSLRLNIHNICMSLSDPLLPRRTQKSVEKTMCLTVHEIGWERKEEMDKGEERCKFHSLLVFVPRWFFAAAFSHFVPQERNPIYVRVQPILYYCWYLLYSSFVPTRQKWVSLSPVRPLDPGSEPRSSERTSQESSDSILLLLPFLPVMANHLFSASENCSGVLKVKFPQ